MLAYEFHTYFQNLSKTSKKLAELSSLKVAFWATDMKLSIELSDGHYHLPIIGKWMHPNVFHAKTLRELQWS